MMAVFPKQIRCIVPGLAVDLVSFLYLLLMYLSTMFAREFRLCCSFLGWIFVHQLVQHVEFTSAR